MATLSDDRIDQLPHLDTHGMDLHKLSGWDEWVRRLDEYLNQNLDWVTKQIIMTCIYWKIENGLEDKLKNDILNQLQIRKEIG